MAILRNRAWMTVGSAPGTGTMTLGIAVAGYQTFAAADVINAQIVRYTAIDGSAWEIGTGTYTSAGTTLSRTLEESSTGGLLNLSANATVFISSSHKDVLSFSESQTFTSGEKTQARANIGAADGKFLIAVVTVTNQGTLPINSAITSAYDVYDIEYDLLPLTDATALYLRTSEDNGNTVNTTLYEYAFTHVPSSGTWASAQGIAAAQIQLSPSVGNLSTEGISGKFTLFNRAGGKYPRIVGEAAMVNASNNLVAVRGAGMRTVNNAINALRFEFSAGNITGTARIYGIKTAV